MSPDPEPTDNAELKTPEWWLGEEPDLYPEDDEEDDE